MTIIRIQIDEKHDTIGLSVQKCLNSTKKEAVLAKAVAEIAKAAINQALENFKSETKTEGEEKQNGR